jgi:nucleoside-diphosphate-sugar epimerase
LGYSLETVYELCNLQSEPRMTRFLAAQLAKSHYFDISRAKNDFGYYPKISSSEGMKRLGDSLRKTEGVADS